MYDMIIVGGGPIGLACGIEAQKAKLNYLILEKGCLVNSLYNYPLNMTFFSTSERLEIGQVPFISHGPKPNRFEALEYYRRVCETWSLNIKLYEKVNACRFTGETFTVETARGKYLSKNVVLALGFYDLPFLLNVPGEDSKK
jgi:thioredoxin reductase (NADPH)